MKTLAAGLLFVVSVLGVSASFQWARESDPEIVPVASAARRDAGSEEDEEDFRRSERPRLEALKGVDSRPLQLDLALRLARR